MIEIFDPWKQIRTECFGNVEPTVQLQAVTTHAVITGQRMTKGITPDSTEMIPAISAGISYGKENNTLSFLELKRLNKKLVKLNHLTPLESIQFNFFVSGISKACGAQLSRHRIGQGHVSLSRRYTKQKPEFVYPMMSYLSDEKIVRGVYHDMSKCLGSSFQYYYLGLLESGVKKADARYLIPVATATARHWWVNARALRDFFRLRLQLTAEAEIRRLAAMIYNMVVIITPSLFEDLERNEHEYDNQVA